VRAERDRAALLRFRRPPTSSSIAPAAWSRLTGSSASKGVATTSRTPSLSSGSSSVLGATELEFHSLLDGRRVARHDHGRPSRVLPDPVEDSVSLAQVLSALPDPEVHRRSLDRYQEAIDG
jgi:hypothetical protein